MDDVADREAQLRAIASDVEWTWRRKLDACAVVIDALRKQRFHQCNDLDRRAITITWLLRRPIVRSRGHLRSPVYLGRNLAETLGSDHA
jgi:hypothetical protein